MSNPEYRPIDLFGGAITVSLPPNFADVSDIRQVPDHQEVWLEQDGFTSVVIDILERVEKPDMEALQDHFADVVGDEDASEARVWSTSTAFFSEMPHDTPCLTLIATAPAGERQRGRANEPDFVGILLSLMRLVEQKTDIVIAINVPHVPGTYIPTDVDLGAGKYGALLMRAMEFREKIMNTFNIRDWSLFVQE